MPEAVEVVADGHGNPPVVVTGTDWLVNVTEEVGALLHGPARVAEPPLAAVVVHVCPRTEATALRPSCGMDRVPVMPVELVESVFRQICHEPFVWFAVRVAAKLKPELLTVHPEKLGGGRGMQLGSPHCCAVKVKVAVVEVHFAVAVPTLNDVLLDETVYVPAAMQPACAVWIPIPSTAATTGATKPRVRPICVAFITVTPEGVGLPTDATARRSGKAALSGCLVP